MYFEGYLVSVSVIIPFILSAFPEDGGRYGTWNSQGICKTWTSCWLTLDVNFGPLSDCRDEGRPNLGIVSVRRIWATVWALLSVVGNVSTHPEKMSTWTRRYLTLQTGGHMGKVYLPIPCWEAASHLMGRKGCQFKVGIGVSTLTCLTGAGKII